MLDLGLDDVNPVNIKIALLPDDLDGFSRDDTKIRLFLTGQGFNFKPDLEAVFRFPDFRHLRPCVTWDHCLLLAVAKREVRDAKKL